jgi:hypothetical protein
VDTDTSSIPVPRNIDIHRLLFGGGLRQRHVFPIVLTKVNSTGAENDYTSIELHAIGRYQMNDSSPLGLLG